jgi:putative ABC transport system ATP-binding protein
VTYAAVLRGVGLTYAGPPPVEALRPTDLTIEVGEYVAIVGPSGSGKSTLLNILGLLDRPTFGVYELDGVDVGALSEDDRTSVRANRIGFIFQAFHLLPYRDAAENVALALLYLGIPARVRRRLALEALDRVGLADRAQAFPTTLSGGERQRVAIARALIGEPRLLLCDEPTGNLDSATAATVLDLVADLHHDGLTVVMITHDPLVSTRATRVVSIMDGRVDAAPALLR